MLSVDAALDEVLKRAAQHAAVDGSLGEALGLVLAADVASDVDSPPHDKSVVDGYAVIAAEVADRPAVLDVLEEVTAGQVPTHPVRPGTAVRIMTGAPLPSGADAVVMVEQTEQIDSPERGAAALARVRLASQRVTPGQNIMRRATSIARGDVVLRAGARIGAAEVGVLAEVGCVRPRVVPRASVAVLSTGNELVDASHKPAAGQIRNSNGPMLLAAVAAAGARAVDLGVARDEAGDLSERIERGLKADVLVICGGVSAGVLDLVPQTLERAGVERVFHKVNIKPGKPLWFGVHGTPPARLVFGLPGNPVSSLVCFELFVRPAIGRLAGAATRVWSS